MKINVLYTTSSMGINSGGPSSSVNLTVNALNRAGVTTEILTNEVLAGDKLISAEHTHILPPARSFARRLKLYKHFLQNNNYSLYNAQGVWLSHTRLTARIARKLGKPYIITPRGMLYPQDIAKSNKYLKLLLLKVYILSDLNKAAAVHATCSEEMEHLRRLGVTSPVAVIPNPINVDKINDEIQPNKDLRLGYLGRIHFRKRVERLIYALASIQNSFPVTELLIIGDGDKDYLDFLKQEVVRLKVRNVTFTGFLSGNDKDEAIRSLSYLVVPSDFENFGNIVTEALVRGVPVIASKGMPWQDLPIHGCGWWINNDVASIAEALKEAIMTSDNERIEMGKRGRKLIQSKYSSEIIAEQMKSLFEFLVNGAAKPEFVYLD